MRQPGSQPPPSAGGGTAAMAPYRRPAHPVARSVWLYGTVSGLFAVLQVAVSVSAALESRGAIDSLYYGMNNSGGFNPIMVIDWLAPTVTAAYGSCLLSFGLSMWMCWLAGRQAARAAGQRSVGLGAGALTSLVSSGIWIAASIAAVLIVHTEGSISGVLTTTPTLSSDLLGPQVGWLVGQEVAASLIALAFGALAGRIGAGAAHVPPPPLRGMPTWPPPPPFIQYPPFYPPTPFGTPQPPGAAPFVVTRVPPAPPGAARPPQPWGGPLAWPGPQAPYPPPVPYPVYPAAGPAPAYPPPVVPPAAQPSNSGSAGAPAAQPTANGAIVVPESQQEPVNGRQTPEQQSDG